MLRQRFIAEIADRHGELVALDPWHEGDPPVPVQGTLEAGTYAEVAVTGGLARPVDVLATPGSSLASLVRVAISQRADPIFSGDVEREVAALVASPGIDDPALTDLRHVPFVTIDNPG